MTETIELIGCEACGKSYDVEQMTIMEDCWFCPSCVKDFEEAFAACDHRWSPHTDSHGDPSQYCDKCGGVVSDEDFERVIGKPIPISTGD